MQFTHPEFLYALVLLLIPVIVHLFQLRRFTKEAFTNVKFLKKVQLQSRKSSRIKKWLTLLARLLALACIIIAFAQPIIPHSQSALKANETIIYIDNSFSMQQKDERGELLKSAVQQLLQTLPGDMPLTVMTNDRVFAQTELSKIKNDLLNLSYSSKDVSLKTIAIKAKHLFSKAKNTQKHFVIISDFQQKKGGDYSEFGKDMEVTFLQLKGKNHINFSIDRVQVPKTEVGVTELQVVVSASRPNTQTLPVSLYEGNTLLAKSSVGFDHNTSVSTSFSLPQSKTNLEGRIEIEDQSLRFDNHFYFSLQKADKIKVAVISADSEKAVFLQKILNYPAFDYTAMQADSWDYNVLTQADFIVLNELKQIPNGLENILQKHLDNGGYLAFIPASDGRVKAYNQLFLQLQLGQFSDFKKTPVKISTINYAHPLFDQVFNGKVTNFQYPEVAGYYPYAGAGHSVLKYNNNRPFLLSKKHTFVFTAPLSKTYSNFKRSPLVVPVFYNMAKQSLQLPQLFYTIGQAHSIAIAAGLNADEVLHLTNKDIDFIPRQQRYDEKVILNTKTLPQVAGTYQVVGGEQSMGHLSFNYNRAENRMKFADLEQFEHVQTGMDIEKFFTTAINENQVDQLWKWFVIFALVFLLTEVAFLKLIK